MPTTTLSVNLDSTEDIRISQIKKQKWLIPFQPVGRKIMRNPDSLDFVDIICTFNKAELFLLGLIKKNLRPNHEIYIRKSLYSSANQQKLTKAISSYIKQSLLKRVRREYYMINPFFMVPSKDDQEHLILQWDNIK